MFEPRLVLALAFLFLMSCGQHDFVDFLEKGKNPSSSSGKEEEDGEVDDGEAEEEADDGICSMVKENGIRYRTVDIGTQTWFAENLNCNVEGSICYNYATANCNKYGRLYSWATAMALPSNCNSYTSDCSSQINAKHRGICPAGWHIPSGDDWQTLMNFVDGTSLTSPADSPTAGKKLKSTSGWVDYEGASGNGTDDYGFTALPGGYGSTDGFYDTVGYLGSWWSTFENTASTAHGTVYDRTMYNSYERVFWNYHSKTILMSIRCVKD